MTAIINKTSLLTQIDSIIAGLNLSTGLTQDLSLYYKTAINAGTSASAVAAEIISRAQNATSAASLEELLLLAVAANAATQNRVVSVANIGALNALTNISVGSVYYVDSENAPFIRKSDGTWALIDLALFQEGPPNGYIWGTNTNGRLGDGTTTNRSSPVSILGRFKDWVQISGGNDHTVGLRNNGTIWAWGSGANGKIGDGTTVNKSSPVTIIGGFTDWIQVTAGYNHSLGLRANGTAWAWGVNTGGRLGDNSVTNRSSPVSVVGGITDWTHLSGGHEHSLGIRATGQLYTWGNGANGRLGDNTTVSKLSPVLVVGGGVSWVTGVASYQQSHGLRADGTIWSWGIGTGGVLGDGTTVPKSSPVSVVGGILDWIDLSSDGAHVLALRANGTAWAWGASIAGSGRLGDGTTINRSSPVSVVGGFTDWVAVSAAPNFSNGIRANGILYGWGSTIGAGIGATSSSSPVSIVGGITDWVFVGAAGPASAAGIRS